MQSDALANVYARSLFELATDAGGNDKIVEIADELEQICELARQNAEVQLFFHPQSLMLRNAAKRYRRFSQIELPT